jgi:hypothetical protein
MTIVKRPSASVAVPVVVPFSTTFTPGKGEPSSVAVTLPETVRSCAKADMHISVSTTERKTCRSLFMLIWFRLIEKFAFEGT